MKENWQSDSADDNNNSQTIITITVIVTTAKFWTGQSSQILLRLGAQLVMSVIEVTGCQRSPTLYIGHNNGSLLLDWIYLLHYVAQDIFPQYYRDKTIFSLFQDFFSLKPKMEESSNKELHREEELIVLGSVRESY